MKCLFSKLFLVIALSTLNCRGAFMPSFELVTDEDTETDFESDSCTETISDICTDDKPTESLQQEDTDTDSDSDSETEPDISSSSDSVSDADSDSELSTQTEKETENDESETESISDSGGDSETVTSSDSISDAGLDTDTDSDENNTTDDNTACPGSCQYNRYTREDLEASGLTDGFSLDPSVNSILICDDGTEGKGFETYPFYTGWIRDNSFECHGIGMYCCRPQTIYDLYCTETGGTCVPSPYPGEGAGFCAFASNECKETT